MTEVDSEIQLLAIREVSVVTKTKTIVIEDDDHKVEQLQVQDPLLTQTLSSRVHSAAVGPFIYLEDLVQRVGVMWVLYNAKGKVILKKLPGPFEDLDCKLNEYAPPIFWQRIEESFLESDTAVANCIDSTQA